MVKKVIKTLFLTLVIFAVMPICVMASTYDEIFGILDDVHIMSQDINKKLDKVLESNVDKFNEILTVKLVDDLLDATKNNDTGKVIDTLTIATNELPNSDNLKKELTEIKKVAKNLETKLNELDKIDNQGLSSITDAQKKDLTDKIKVIEKDYIDFVKVIMNKYSDIYLKVIFDKSKNVSIEKMIEYANKGLDIIGERDNIINDLAKDRLPQGLMDKDGILAALGVIDDSSLDNEYIKVEFSSELENIALFVVDEVLDYIDNIDSLMKNEIKDIIANSDSPEVSQVSVIKINEGRLKTLSDLKELQNRAEKELLSTQEKLKEKLSKYAPRVYDIFNANILDTIETIMSLENEKEIRAYEYNDVYSYIVMDSFVEGKDFTKTIGLPEESQGALEFNNLANGKVRTGSTLTIKLSEYVYQIYYYAVLGDVDGNCVVDSMDMYKVIQHILENSKLQNEFYRAGNTNDDSKIDSMDMYNIIQIILKK